MTFASAPFAAGPFAAASGTAAELAGTAAAQAGASGTLTTPPSGMAGNAAARASAFGQLAPNLTIPVQSAAFDGDALAQAAARASLSTYGNGPPAGPSSAAALAWRPVIRLGGVDVSARLTGSIEIEIEENAARIASFALAPVAGAVPITDWVGKPVEIDFADRLPDGSAANPVRLFGGLVEVPEYELASGVTRFSCTDLLQESLDNAPRADIDTLLGGRWSAAVSGEAATAWDYAQAQLLSLPAALDLDAWRSPRLTPWAAKAAADVVLGPGDIVDGSAAVRFASRSSLRNSREVTFQYRYPLLKKRGIVRGYTYPFELGSVVSNGYDIPTRDMVRQALDGTGWELAGEINFAPVPGVPAGVAVGEGAVVTGKVYVPLFGIPVVTDDGHTAFWSVAQDVADQLCFGYVARLCKRWAQTVDEVYTLTVAAPASVVQLGTIADEAQAALENSFDTSAWEAGPPAASGGNVLAWGAIQNGPLPEVPDPYIGEAAMPYAGDPATDRAAADHAIATLIDQARAAILGSHRLNAVEAELPIAPHLDVVHTVRVDTPALLAQGKLRRVRHVMDLESGRAVTAIELALSRTEATGLQTDTPVAVPVPPPAPELPPPEGPGAVIATWIGRSVDTPSALPSNATGFFTNLSNTFSPAYNAAAETYPVQLIVEAPEIEAEARDNREVPIAASYEVAIPEDLLTLTVP